MSPELRFRHTLEQVRIDSDACVQFLYAWVAFHKAASKSAHARAKINENALYWNTVLGALQTSLFIALGRLFDRDKKSHGLHKLLRIAILERHIFSKASLAKRKAKESPGATWINTYLADAYVPSLVDLRKLQKYVATKRLKYVKTYAPIRNKVFAHNGLGSLQKVSVLFSRTNIGELQRLILGVRQVHEVLWQLYFNGSVYQIKRQVWTVSALLRRARRARRNVILPLPQQMVKEVTNVVSSL